MKTELRDDNLPAPSLSPVKGRSVGSFRRVLQNRSFLLLWLAQLLSQIVFNAANYGVWLPPGQRVRYTNWRPFERSFSNGKKQTRFIRELVFGQRGHIRYYNLTTDREKLPPESTWYIMTNLEGKIQKTVGNTYGLRTWIEYGFKHAKNELGWADFRVTNYASIERWWELICCAYLLVSVQSPVFQHGDDASGRSLLPTVTTPFDRFVEHR